MGVNRHFGIFPVCDGDLGQNKLSQADTCFSCGQWPFSVTLFAPFGLHKLCTFWNNIEPIIEKSAFGVLELHCNFDFSAFGCEQLLAKMRHETDLCEFDFMN